MADQVSSSHVPVARGTAQNLVSRGAVFLFGYFATIVLARAIYHSDAPLTHANSVAFLLISEFGRKQGVKICLSGEAADELFGGYMQRYRHSRQILMLKRWTAYLPAKIRKAFALAATACNGVPFSAISKYQGLLAHSTDFLDKGFCQG